MTFSWPYFVSRNTVAIPTCVVIFKSNRNNNNKKIRIRNKHLISVLALRAPEGLHVTLGRKPELGVTLTQARRETEVVRRWQCGWLVSALFHRCCQSAQEGGSSRVMLRLRLQHFI